ncbi:GCN5 family acetyltransferase [Hyphomicrobium nitrativorans NL23]|uniref:GCN5 family acetyltransferase n=1 Tax=Hyphomicrobium nitrativorans NL23 TaxID=1029756 RepID=V5SFZ9_9HYPH|nr:GNAT family N-acetyltransferase [Hyphomicrobium nitrativorans]AHB49427.1 GCN5 family acetyltransferase [Hyphomicrobium nitrativorans NL23]
MTDFEICRWDGLDDAEQRWLVADIDHVFFSSSNTQSFETEAAKAAFRARWLGRYLLHFPQYAFLARDGAGRAIGYIVGNVADPARDPIFSDLPFLSAFADASARYPAHLHVNVVEAYRGQAIGARLIDTFALAARDAGANGVHVVTQRGARNVRFYNANGFQERAAVSLGETELVFLGRDLGRDLAGRT